MELELENLAPYLPYQLKLQHGENEKVMNAGNGSSKYWVGISSVIKWNRGERPLIKPIPLLRPIWHLANKIEHNGEVFTPTHRLAEILFDVERENFDTLKDSQMWVDVMMMDDLSNLPYKVFIKLIEWHFDVFGHLAAGNAVTLSTLN